MVQWSMWPGVNFSRQLKQRPSLRRCAISWGVRRVKRTTGLGAGRPKVPGVYCGTRLGESLGVRGARRRTCRSPNIVVVVVDLESSLKGTCQRHGCGGTTQNYWARVH